MEEALEKCIRDLVKKHVNSVLGVVVVLRDGMERVSGGTSLNEHGDTYMERNLRTKPRDVRNPVRRDIRRHLRADCVES